MVDGVERGTKIQQNKKSIVSLSIIASRSFSMRKRAVMTTSRHRQKLDMQTVCHV